jgi:hypothetical protein
MATTPAATSTAPAQTTTQTQNPSAPAQTETPTQAKAEVARMLKLKVDGKELELPESEVISRAAKASAADKRFQEAAQTRKQAEEIIKFAKDNPTEFFKRTGMNAREWAEQYLLQEIQREQMTPEQKKAWENEQKLRQYEESEKQAKARAKAEQDAALERHHAEQYDQFFVKALSEVGLPRTPYTVSRMAQLEMVNLKKGLKLLPSQLATIVREDYIAEQKALFGSMEGDALMEILGKDNVKKLSKAQLSKYKSAKTLTSSNIKKNDAKPKNPMDAINSWKAYQKKTRSMI